MLDIKFIRSNPETVKESLIRRNGQTDLVDEFLKVDEERRKKLVVTEQLKGKRNTVSEEVGKMKKAGQNCEDLVLEMREVSQQIKNHDEEIRQIEEQLQAIVLSIPNVPHETVPIGADESDNREERRWGEPRKFAFPVKAHWDLSEKLNILDFERAAKVTGARFTFYRGLGARLERALISFMLDLHTQEHGYVELLPPYIVNRDSMIGTGQLPKFAEDMFHLDNSEYYLIPTAEVPVTNYYRDEILAEEELPLYYTAYSACFRAEAGSAGRAVSYTHLDVYKRQV